MAKPSRVSPWPPRRKPSTSGIAIDVSALGHHEEREQAVGDLAGEPETGRRDRAGIYRQRVAGVDDALQRLAEPGGVRPAVGERIVHALVDDRLLARHDSAHDRNVLAQPLMGFAVGDSMPAFDHLRSRRTNAEDETTAGECLERHRRHRCTGRCARWHLHERGADCHPPRSEPESRRLASPRPSHRPRRSRSIGSRAPQPLGSGRCRW